MADGIAAAATVNSIFVYPIKSCRGISTPQAPLTSTGFRFDRQWVVINSKGRAFTQRVEPKLALVVVELPNQAFFEQWVPKNNSYMVVKAPGMDVLNVPLTRPSQILDGVSVWEWSGSAMDEGDDAANWFTNYLGKTSRLVRFNDASEVRPTDPNYARGHKVMFSDMFPFLLASQGSIDAFNGYLKEPVSINRFRPNILVDGCEPFSEDLWTEVKINNLTFQGVKLCDRCKIPTINQETTEVEPVIAEALEKCRSDKVVRPSKNPRKGKVYFGQNLICTGDSLAPDGQGQTIKVGDPVVVLKMLSSAADAAV